MRLVKREGGGVDPQGHKARRDPSDRVTAQPITAAVPTPHPSNSNGLNGATGPPATPTPPLFPRRQPNPAPPCLDVGCVRAEAIGGLKLSTIHTHTHTDDSYFAGIDKENKMRKKKRTSYLMPDMRNQVSTLRQKHDGDGMLAVRENWYR